ncbi:MAG: precorrin-2 C(20)-methyltransferase [Cyanobacteriota bacterium]|nr:precorrin-2 C(20)-methyltransferase [Cyanobacteriota bacterium]
MVSSWGTFWGVSAGAGDPAWLTVQGQHILRTVDLVAFPQDRQGQPGVAYRIIHSHLRPEQEVMALALPFVQDQAILQQAWQQAIDQLWPWLASGRDVAFVCEGDVSLYSTFTYLAQTLRQRQPEVPIHAIPGVCSPLAAAAVLGDPLALGEEKIAILPAMYSVNELESVLAWADVVVLMKVSAVFDQVWQWLAAHQLLQQASLVVEGGSSQQQIYRTLVGLEDFRPPYFSLVVIWKNRSPSHVSLQEYSLFLSR